MPPFFDNLILSRFGICGLPRASQYAGHYRRALFRAYRCERRAASALSARERKRQLRERDQWARRAGWCLSKLARLRDAAPRIRAELAADHATILAGGKRSVSPDPNPTEDP